MEKIKVIYRHLTNSKLIANLLIKSWASYDMSSGTEGQGIFLLRMLSKIICGHDKTKNLTQLILSTEYLFLEYIKKLCPLAASRKIKRTLNINIPQDVQQ
jgi:hypothetical protein